MKLNKGWLYRQFKRTSEDVQRWPDWMKREAGFSELVVERQIAPSSSLHPPVTVTEDEPSHYGE